MKSSASLTLAIYLLAPLAMNGIIFGLGWATPHPANPLLPPGWAVGTIWMALFAAMGISRWLVRAKSSALAHAVDALAFLCLIYPLYTLGLSSDRIGLAGTIVTALLAAGVVIRLARRCARATALTSAVLIWLIYAGIATGIGLQHGIR
jgi:tryptophan-rich sensory protein